MGPRRPDAPRPAGYEQLVGRIGADRAADVARIRSLLASGRTRFDPVDLVFLVHVVTGVEPGATDVPLDTAVELALRQAATGDGYTDLTLAKYVDQWRAFARYAAAVGCRYPGDVTPAVAEDWISSRGRRGHGPSAHTLQTRRGMLRTLFRVLRQLHLAAHDPTLDLALDARPGVSFRPLTDHEMLRVQAVAPSTVRDSTYACVVALAQASATTREIALVTVADIDLDRGTVALHGDAWAAARTAELTPWGWEHVERRVRRLGDNPAAHLACGGQAGLSSSTSAIGTKLIRVLKRALLFHLPDVGVPSLRAWAGRRIWDETRDIEAVRRVLGVSRLDAAAAIICLPPEDRR